MGRFPTRAALLGFLAIAAGARADTLSFNAVSTFTFSPSTDQFAFSGGSFGIWDGGMVVDPTGAYYLGPSGSLVLDIPVSFEDTVTLDGITGLLSFAGDDDLTFAHDALTVDAFGTLSFTNEMLSPPSGGETPTPPQYSEPTAVTPEPSTLLLLGSGMATTLQMVRRRRRQAVRPLAAI